MNNRILISGLIVILLIIGLSGCVENNNTNSNEKNTKIDNNLKYKTNLTDADWDYFVFHYNSGKDLNSLFNSGFNIINNEISWFDPENSSFLIEFNKENKDILVQLNNISKVMNENISQYRNILQNFSLSKNMINHSLKQEKIILNYQNLSNTYLSIYMKINAMSQYSNNNASLVDISEEMQIIFKEDERIKNIMDEQVEIIINIPEEEWNNWTKDRDWSFMD